MKYIVTEEQLKTAEQSVRAYRLERTILEYLHNHLTPFEGTFNIGLYGSVIS
jgi:hypothetical protein